MKKIPVSFQENSFNDAKEIEFSKYIKEYVEARYNYLFDVLLRFSSIAKTYFNMGTYESPLHYNVLKELAFLLDLNESYIRKIAMLSSYRETYKQFLVKLKSANQKKLIYIGGHTAIEGDLLIAGIAGLNPNTIPGDSLSDFQEKMTEDLMSTMRRQLSYANKILILNQSQGKLRKEPFAFRPASHSLRNFIEETRGKMKQKIFVQSYHHFMTTHFYNAFEFSFILNNAAVNNCLFNILDIGLKVNCYDVDPKLGRLRLLKNYNYNVVDYANQQERLALNYEDSNAVIQERKINGCYYM